MNSGSLLGLNVSARCGLRRNAFQIRPTVDFDSPDRFAIDARDQWVASFGACSKVATTTSSTLSSLIFRGAPGRSSSTRPSSRRTTNRDRHLPTVGRDTPSRPATSALDSPSAHASTIRQRNANACALLRRWDQPTNVSRSTSDSASSALGRPRPAIRQSLHQQSHHRDTTLPQLDNESTALDTTFFLSLGLKTAAKGTRCGRQPPSPLPPTASSVRCTARTSASLPGTTVLWSKSRVLGLRFAALADLFLATCLWHRRCITAQFKDSLSTRAPALSSSHGWCSAGSRKPTDPQRSSSTARAGPTSVGARRASPTPTSTSFPASTRLTRCDCQCASTTRSRTR